jgi:hypothetical protein
MNAKRSLEGGSGHLTRPDHKAWAYRSPCFRALNFTFGIRSVDAEIGRYLEHVLSGLVSPHDEPGVWYSIMDSTEKPDRPYSLVFGPEPLTLAHDKAFALRVLLWHVNNATVSSERSCTVLHAGGVALDGVGAIISGPSGSGKTTLTAALVQAGFKYLTDEAVAFDPVDGLLHPYPKALAIQAGSWELLSALRPPPSEFSPKVWHVAPTAIRADAIGRPVPPSMILFPTHERPMGPGGENCTREIARSEALMELFPQCFGDDSAQARTMRVLGALVERCRCFRVSTEDLPGAVRSISELMRLPPANLSRAT